MQSSNKNIGSKPHISSSQPLPAQPKFEGRRKGDIRIPLASPLGSRIRDPPVSKVDPEEGGDQFLEVFLGDVFA